MPIERIDSELAGVRESEMRRRIDSNFQELALGGVGGAAPSPSVPSITYVDGLITVYVSGGVTHAVGYDAQNRAITNSYGGTVETLTYNAATGLVQSFTVTGGAAGQDVTAVTYEDGQISGATVGGVPETIVYDAQRRVSTYSAGGSVLTVSYNLDGTVASYL